MQHAVIEPDFVFSFHLIYIIHVFRPHQSKAMCFNKSYLLHYKVSEARKKQLKVEIYKINKNYEKYFILFLIE